MGKVISDSPQLPMHYLPVRIRCDIGHLSEQEQSKITEIRLRLGQPPAVSTINCRITDLKYSEPVSGIDITEAMRLLTGSSVYALENDLKNGFITVPGGHRVGICGSAVVRNGKVKTQKEISSLNYRVAREVINSGNGILPYLYDNNQVLNTLIFSPPGAGKTTLLRDLIRLIANGNRYGTARNVTVIDERREIGGLWKGQACFDLGLHTDILSDFSKAEGMTLALRSLAPAVLAADEIGDNTEAVAAMNAVYAGVSLLMTAHAGSFAELRQRPMLNEWLEKGIFSLLIGLKNDVLPGTVTHIYRKNTEGSGDYDEVPMCMCDYSCSGNQRRII